MTPRHNRRNDRLSVVSRSVAAAIGGYGVVTLLAAAITLSLPMPRLEAVMTATLIAFLAYACIIMAVFHARSASLAWIGLAALAGPLAIIVLLLSGTRP